MDLKLLAGRALGVEAPSGISITDLCEDSRQAAPGMLFVAVPGTKNDGAQYAHDAVARGAVAIVAEPGAVVHTTVPVVRVVAPRLAAAKLAGVLYGLDRLLSEGSLRVVGVTGTNGKSTFAFMVRHLLKYAGRTPALIGTIEFDLVGRKLPADMTTPDAAALARYLAEAHAAGARDVVMEVSSHSLAQHRVDFLRFDTAVFTNLTQDHLDLHGSMENYLLAKRRLFDGLDGQATAIVNGHDLASARMIEQCRARVLKYGLSTSRDMQGLRGTAVLATLVEEGRGGSRFLLEYEGKRVELRTPLVGRHNVFNAISAAAAGISLGIDLPMIQRGLAELRHVPGRLQQVPTGDLGFDVFVDYAHTDDALRNVLHAVRPFTSGRLYCVFGCGGDRDKPKRPKMARAVAELADCYIITSDNPRFEDPLEIIRQIETGLTPEDRGRGRTLPDRRAAIDRAVKELLPGDCLVIAGKGHENYQDVRGVKNHFDDVEVAAEAVARRQVTGVCVP